MLGFADLRVLDAVEVDGELEVVVETTAVRAWCRSCGVRAHAHARAEVVVRDVAAFDRRVRLRWRKRRWRCREAACPASTWTETHAGIAPRAALTERARRQACRRVGRDGQAVAVVAGDLGVGWHTVMRAVEAYGRPLVDDPARLAGVTRLGMDETAWLTANRRHHTPVRLWAGRHRHRAPARCRSGSHREGRDPLARRPRAGVARARRRGRARPAPRLI